MRDKLKPQSYFLEYVNTRNVLISETLNQIKNNEIGSGQIEWVKKNILDQMFSSVIAKYSYGENLETLQNDLKKVIDYLPEAWTEKTTKAFNNKGVFYKFYNLDAYDQILWILSLGCLLNIDRSYYELIAAIIDRDQIKDHLLEYLIKYKITDRAPIQNESYEKYFDIPKIYEKLRQVILLGHTDESRSLLKEFISNDWYKSQKHAGWYNSHRSKFDTYYGYWCFEGAAICKILAFDKDFFNKVTYFPTHLL